MCLPTRYSLASLSGTSPISDGIIPQRQEWNKLPKSHERDGSGYVNVCT